MQLYKLQIWIKELIVMISKEVKQLAKVKLKADKLYKKGKEQNNQKILNLE